MKSDSDKCWEKNKARQGMEEDIFIGYSAMAFSDKMIIVQRGAGSELSGYLDKNIPGSGNIKYKDPESNTCLAF